MKFDLRIIRRALILGAAFLAFASQALAQAPRDPSLMGTRNGLYRLDGGSKWTRIWAGGEVRRIIRTDASWFLLTSQGVIASPDLIAFSPRNAGMPTKMVKEFRADAVSFHQEIQELKDLEVDPANPSVLSTCSKDDVFLSRDAGLSWQRFPTPVGDISGLKAAFAFSAPRLTLIASHPIKGLFVIYPDDKKPSWAPFSAGLETVPGTSFPDEIADIKAVKSDAGFLPIVSGSFRPQVYAWNAQKKAFFKAWSGKADFGMVESLCPLQAGIPFVREGGIGIIPAGIDSASPAPRDLSALPNWKEGADALERAKAEAGTDLQSIWFPGPAGDGVSLNELWLVEPRYPGDRIKKAAGKEGLYLVTGFVNSKLDFYTKLVEERGLNMLTIDMKDDFGHLRYKPRSEYVKSIGKVSSPIDVEAFVAAMKPKGIYLVARIVVFKDQVVYDYAKGKYAVWDKAEQKPWNGYFTRIKENPSPSPGSAAAAKAPPGAASIPSPAPSPSPEYYRDYMEEYWVDPYCEWVWKYNVEIAKEIIERGFDEVQFDYIRFPTDGENLANATYRFKGEGMDKESALMSFLSYARENVAAPISVDIYGANGWYRTGVRTGQDVEMLQRYVDVICPMYYPSHFEQDFYAMAPAEERPYRIYYYGTLRNTYIGRYRVAVRPWVQAFKMNVRYDNKYYDKAYVVREVTGVRAAADMGMTFWNNSGRYDDIPDMRPLPASVPSAAAAAMSNAILD